MLEAAIEREVRDIVAMFVALEKSDGKLRFEGFDSQDEGSSSMPYEGDHLRYFRAYREQPEIRTYVEHWPDKSHGRNLVSYRSYLRTWDQILGRPSILTPGNLKRFDLA